MTYICIHICRAVITQFIQMCQSCFIELYCMMNPNNMLTHFKHELAFHSRCEHNHLAKFQYKICYPVLTYAIILSYVTPAQRFATQVTTNISRKYQMYYHVQCGHHCSLSCHILFSGLFIWIRYQNILNTYDLRS